MDTLFVVEINSDLTEGRGNNYPIFYCKSRTTAERLAKKKNVMGSDGNVHEVKIFEHQGKKYLPLHYVHIQHATESDLKADEIRKKKQETIDKAKRLGLSDEDLALLGRN